jgi:hypothetical protein
MGCPDCVRFNMRSVQIQTGQSHSAEEASRTISAENCAQLVTGICNVDRSCNRAEVVTASKSKPDSMKRSLCLLTIYYMAGAMYITMLPSVKTAKQVK